LPKSIRIPEIGQQAFEQGVAAACGSKDGAPDCLTVTYLTVSDPDHGCGFEWVSDPPKVSVDEGLAADVQRGSTLTATIFTCPESGKSTPTDGGSMSSPDGAGSSPDGAGSTPDGAGSGPDGAGSTPDGAGGAPDGAGGAPDGAGSAPDDAGTTSEPAETEAP
jgi:hypothetical protein